MKVLCVAFIGKMVRNCGILGVMTFCQQSYPSPLSFRIRFDNKKKDGMRHEISYHIEVTFREVLGLANFTENQTNI